MRKQLWGVLAFAISALIIFFGFSIFIFSRNLTEARHQSESKLFELAGYVAGHIQEDVFAEQFTLPLTFFPLSYAQQQGLWLQKLSRAAGLERVFITDSSGNLYVSSQGNLNIGTQIIPFLADSMQFFFAGAQNQPALTSWIKSKSVYYQSIYFPFLINGKIFLVVMESDQNFIANTEQFRKYIFVGSLFLLGLLFALTMGLILLDKKVNAALIRSQHQERLVFLGQTAAELAHELKNPLGIMKASIDILRKQIDPEHKNKVFMFLSDETMRLSRLINNILSFSKEKTMDKYPFSVLLVLQECQAGLEVLHPEVHWDFKIPSNLQLIGDKDAFRQIAENLLRNAIQALAGKGRLCVAFENKISGKNQLLFLDNGPGVSMAVKAKLFEPFVSESESGTGLGLAIVKKLCEKLDWNISVQTATLPYQTAFVLEFPSEAMQKE